MKKNLTIFLAILMLISVTLVGCGQSSTPTPNSQSTTAMQEATATTPPAAPAELSLTLPYSVDMNGSNDRVIAEIEKKTNTKLTIISTAWDSYVDKMNVMAASGEMPDIVSMMQLENKTIIDSWIKNGLIIPFSDEMLKVAPIIKKEYDETVYYQELLVDGKIYFQPIFWSTKPSPNTGILQIRKDFLDKLGLQPPETLDDLYNAMKLMKEKLNVYGLTFTGKEFENARSWLAGAFGLPSNGWIKDDKGDYVYANIQPQMKEALKFFKKLFDEKLIDPESFANSIEQSEQKFFNGKAGMLVHNGGGHLTRINESIKKVDPKGEVYLLAAPAGPDGKRGYLSEPSFWAVTGISGTSKNPVAAAGLLNFLLSDEGIALTTWGIEGVHYTKDTSGNIVINTAERDKEGTGHWANNQYHQMAMPIVSWVPQNMQEWWNFNGKEKAVIDWYGKMLENQLKYTTTNEIMINSTPMWGAFTNKSKDFTNEYYIKIIMGKLDVDKGFDEYVKKWNATGGSDASKEMSEARKNLK